MHIVTCASTNVGDSNSETDAQPAASRISTLGGLWLQEGIQGVEVGRTAERTESTRIRFAFIESSKTVECLTFCSPPLVRRTQFILCAPLRGKYEG